jgi:hypothetical protein
MRGTEYSLRTAAADIRVTRTQSQGGNWTPRSINTLVFKVGPRLRRRPRLFTAVDIIFRRVASNTLIQPLYLQNRIELAPRLALTVRREWQHIRTLEQKIKTRILRQPGAEPRAMERITRLFTACVERQQSLSPREGNRSDVPLEVHNVFTRVGADHLVRPLDAVTDYRRPPSIEMVVQHSRPAALITTEAPTVAATEQPKVTAQRRGPSSSSSVRPLDGNYLRRLTDSVVEALDRRAIAAHERTGRRSA